MGGAGTRSDLGTFAREEYERGLGFRLPVISSAESASTPRMVFTSEPGRVALEYNSKAFECNIKDASFPSIRELPRFHSFSSGHASGRAISRGTPVTVYNDWPRKLNNASIFPYLLPFEEDDEDAKYKGFYSFVKNWYQSACAIVYYSFEDDPQIIGSGSLIGEGLVSTARHVFEAAALDHLYVRFFHFIVEKSGEEEKLLVHENYLDIPVVRSLPASSGLDAGYLSIPDVDRRVLDKYAKVIGTPGRSSSPVRRTISPGHYAMFHFAGGMPQVSIGDVRDPDIGAKLHDDIHIQGGPGASGASIIWSVFDKASAIGTSIYRRIKRDTEEADSAVYRKITPDAGGAASAVVRRTIRFEDFERPTCILDAINAPYRGRSAPALVTPDFYVDGYEFLKWERAWTLEGGSSRPASRAYEVEEGHQNHHIIPRGDLWFLWEYFVNNSARTSIEKIVKRIEKIVKREELDAKSKGKTFDDRDRFAALVAAEESRYASIKSLLSRLHPERRVREQTSRGFAWSYWNLFKGWGGDHRADDPAHFPTDGYDYSEKIMPKSFNKGIWEALKRPRTGLYYCIQNIKMASKEGLPSLDLLTSLESSLVEVLRIWSKIEQVVHRFNPTDWSVSRDGKYFLLP